MRKPGNQYALKWLTWLTILLLVGLYDLPMTVAAQNQVGVKMTAQAGFDDYCKVNQWIPVKVTLENSGPAIRGLIQAPIQSASGNTYTYATPIDLPEASKKELFLYLFSDSYLLEQPIYLLETEQVIQTTQVRLNCLPQTDRLVGVVASSPTSFTILNELDPENGSASVAILEITELPDRPEGWEALDILLISNVDTAILTNEQQNALAGWLASGGRLVVSGGIGWQKTVAGLEHLLPILPANIQSLDSLQQLVIFSRSLQSLPTSTQPIPISRGSLVPGAITLVEQDDVPVVIRSQYGYGDVFYLAFDPSVEPLKTWEGMIDFYRVMFAYQFDLPGWANGFQNWQLAQEAASSLPGIALPSAIFVCSFLGLYVIVVGPINYLVLRRLKRRELTWITIPAMVVLFSLLAMVIGNFSRGRTPLISQTSIVQVWPEAGQSRVDGLAGIYSPSRTTYQIQIHQQSLAHPIITYDIVSQEITVLQNNESLSIPDLRVDIGGLETFVGDGYTEAYPIDNQLRIIIDQSGAILQGQVINQGDQTLEDAVILYPGGTRNLGSLAPGASYEVNVPLSLAQASGKPQSVPYSPFTTFASPSMAYPYYGYGYYLDPTIQDILGTTSYYENKEIYQRFTLINSVLGSSSSSTGRGGGIYLCGWVEKSGMDIQLVDRPARQNNISLFLVNLTPKIETAGAMLKLSPGLFVWESMSDNASNRSNPYSGAIYTNETQHIRFRFGMPFLYTSIQDLSFHLESNLTNQPPTDLIVSLWDFETSQWVQLENVIWGENFIPQPDRFVGPAGIIQLSIANTGASQYEITRSDFTMMVNR